MKIGVEAQMLAAGTGKEINLWFIENVAPDMQRMNWYTGEIQKIESKTSQRFVVESLAEATAADTVNLYINSMGGSVKEALGIYSALRRCPAKVVAHIDGFAASAASVIAMAAQRVIMPRNTCMMVHNAAWETYGNPAELRKSADDLEIINMAAIQSYMIHAGDKLPADKLAELLNAETWLTAEMCMQYGLADEYADTDADLDEALRQFAAAAAADPKQKAAQKPPSFAAAAEAKELPVAEERAASKSAEPQQRAPEMKSAKKTTYFEIVKHLIEN